MLYKSKFFQCSLGILIVLIILSLLRNMGFIIVFLKQMFSVIFTPILIGILFYYILRPIVRVLEKRGIKKREASSLVSLVIMSLLIVGIIYGGSSIKNSFTTSFEDLSEEFQSGIEVIDDKFSSVVDTSGMQEKINKSMAEFMGKIGGDIPNLFSQIANVGTQIIIIPFIVFYLLKDDRYFGNKVLDITPNKYKSGIKTLLIDIDTTLYVYITGQLIVAIVLGVLMYLGFKIIKIPHAMLLSMFAMITNIIPFIGPFIGAMPAIITALTVDFWMVLKVIIVSFIVQQLEGNVITPNIIGNRLEIHPLMVLIIVFISISIFGVIGAFIGIPLYAVIKVIIKNLHKIYKVRNIQTDKLKIKN